MKVLIVDDEIHVFKSIQILVNLDNYGITEMFYAQNGVRALEILWAENPEIIITDMQMPEMNGVEFIQKVREEGFDSQIIAISGHDDFEYVRAVVVASGVDYILKPVSRKGINTALQKATDMIKQKNELGKTAEEVEQERRNQLCARLGLWFNGTEEGSEQLNNEMEKLFLEEKSYTAIAILLKNTEEILQDVFNNDQNVYNRKLSSLIADIYGSDECYVFPVETYLKFLVVEEKETAIYSEQSKIWENRVSKRIKEQLLDECLISRLPLPKTFADYPKIFDRLKSNLQRRILIWKDGKTAVADSNATIDKVSFYEGKINGMGYLLKTAVKNKDLAAVDHILSEFCEEMEKKNVYSLYELQIYTSEINLILKKILAESFDIDTFRLPTVSAWIYDLKIWEDKVKNAFYEMTACRFEKVLNIASVREYVNENYTKEISLTFLSMEFCQSLQYMSKIYKKKYGETIGETIKRKRIEKAEEYLLHSNLNIGEIAHLVGYEDANYFGKVFRSVKGVNPQSMRKG
ncbi:MAG: response regulator [Lachnospiraceae bacterium]|nr:response regulator [Lachnospiraceae bacterium]